ncbi:MAG TPA: hypothetical protein VGC37_09120, partial [Friedmanniella sp.]
DVRLGGLGLTRMAPEGSLVVNSSRGGGAKDTWIVSDPDAMGDPVDAVDASHEQSDTTGAR